MTQFVMSKLCCSVEIINVEDTGATREAENGRSKDYVHPSNMEVRSYIQKIDEPCSEVAKVKEMTSLYSSARKCCKVEK